MPALAVTAVSKRYGKVAALDNVSFSLATGACMAVVGESGSGKTSLLRLFNRLIDADSGVVEVGGRAVSSLDPIQLRRQTGYVPQEGGLLPHWRVLRNVALVPRLLAQPDADLRARGSLELVGLNPAEFAHRWPAELSGGQRQRVALARALAAQPAMLLLDEAFGALDAITRAEVQEAFVRVRAATGVTTILVTHDLSEALRLADQVMVLRNGRVEQVGEPHAVVRAPASDYVRELVDRARSAWPPELQ